MQADSAQRRKSFTAFKAAQSLETEATSTPFSPALSIRRLVVVAHQRLFGGVEMIPSRDHTQVDTNTRKRFLHLLNPVESFLGLVQVSRGLILAVLRPSILCDASRGRRLLPKSAGKSRVKKVHDEARLLRGVVLSLDQSRGEALDPAEPLRARPGQTQALTPLCGFRPEPRSR